ncbi:hypothetical protein OSB04_014841 [Centaurea solstitialis]|uniref:Uncharacterized protein n=1 Tax=Centaurea solstitialis TaxID=347529 RepID=A0AA38T921_9ASTR|nr:hypothetical protein OSB04_014841 [Centaurea solstitialis]
MDVMESEPSSSNSLQESQPCRPFVFPEIQQATNDFDESLIIGRGGFGKVYKGNITNGSSVVVAAIKRLDTMSNQGATEFWAEVEMLSKLRHCNLVSLFGYCNYEKEMILVYEYMPNGTLEDHLHKLGTPLSWLQRLNICVGAARGLHYLHTGTGIDIGVIHRDVKSSNILLNESWAAKISDFGLSKVGPTNQPSTYVNTLVKGTFGYLDPDYYETGKLTRKSDVYALGVVLLEVLCRKPAVDRSDEEQWLNLARWAQETIKEGNLKHIIDPDIRGQISPKCLKEFVRIIKRCLHNNPQQRSTMAGVLVSLESVLTIQEKFNNSLELAGKTIFGRMADMIPFPSKIENSATANPTPRFEGANVLWLTQPRNTFPKAPSPKSKSRWKFLVALSRSANVNTFKLGLGILKSSGIALVSRNVSALMAPQSSPISSSDSANSSSSSQIMSLPAINLNQVFSVKLDSNNYLIWKNQLLNVVISQGLEGYLDGSKPQPPKFLSIDTTQVNQEYILWGRYNRLIMSWIYSSLSESMLTQIVAFNTAHEIWNSLAQIYSASSLARVTELRTSLQTLKKQGLSITAYIQKLKGICNSLAAIGEPVTREDHLIYLLGGLGREYNAFVASIHTRADKPTVEEVHSLLMSFDYRLETQNAIDQIDMAQANLTHASHASKFKKPFKPNSQFQVRPHVSYRPQSPIPSVLGKPPHRPNIQPWKPSFNPKPQCQICNKPGHTALNCYHRANLSYQPNFTPKNLNTYMVSPDFSSNASRSESGSDWFMDSGATHHFTPDFNAMDLASPYHGCEKVTVSDGKQRTISNIGRKCFSTNSSSIYLNNILHSPSLSHNLVSVSKLCRDNNAFVKFYDDSFLVKDLLTKKTLLQGLLDRGLYRVVIPPPAVSTTISSRRYVSPRAYLTRMADPIIWHQRLGHSAVPVVNHVMRVCNIPAKQCCSSYFCNSCQLAKAHKLPFSISLSRAAAPFDLVYMDVWGPSPKFSIDGFRYFLLVVDDYSRFSWIFCLKSKDEVVSNFAYFQSLIRTQYNSTIKVVQTDGGGEFKPLSPILKSQGTIHRFSCPYTSAQNGRVERKHRHVVEVGLALLAQSSMPLSYWSYAFCTAVHIINRLPTAVLNDHSPFSMLYDKSPDYNHLRVFGCACFPLLRPYNNHKLMFRSTECVYLGPSSAHKGYLCLNKNTGRIYVSRHVIFNEHFFPFSQTFTSPSTPSTSTSNSTPSFCSFSSIPITISSSTPDLPANSTTSSSSLPVSPVSQPSVSPVHPPPSPSVPLMADPSLSPDVVNPTPVSNTHPMITRAKDGIFKPKRLLTGVSTPSVPSTLKQALTDPNWITAMEREISALHQNHTWTLVPKPPNANIVGSKWVYKLKLKPNGDIERYKARLVAKGYSQTEGLDYFETFSPVVKPTTIRIVLSLATAHNWFIRQLDVQNAFLHGDLSEQVYMSQPPGFVDSSNPNLALNWNQFRILSVILVLNLLSKTWGTYNIFWGLKFIVPLMAYISAKPNILKTSSPKHQVTPMAATASLSINDGMPLPDGSEYRSIVGALQYCTLTRPDIAFSVNKVCQFMHAPSDYHWQLVKRILRYLAGTSQHGLFYHAVPDSSLLCYTDADWASCPDDRRSTSGYCIFLGYNLISWSSSKQRVVSRSSTESEYRSLANGTAELMWVQYVLRDLHLSLSRSPLLPCDNIGATYLSSNPVMHSRTKHVEIDYHFVRERVAAGDLTVRYIPAKEQLADCLTKPLPTNQFLSLRTKLTVLPRPMSLRGDVKPIKEKEETTNTSAVSSCTYAATTCIIPSAIPSCT